MSSRLAAAANRSSGSRTHRWSAGIPRGDYGVITPRDSEVCHELVRHSPSSERAAPGVCRSCVGACPTPDVCS